MTAPRRSTIHGRRNHEQRLVCSRDRASLPDIRMYIADTSWRRRQGHERAVFAWSESAGRIVCNGAELALVEGAELQELFRRAS